jgi:hypothetical protein
LAVQNGFPDRSFIADGLKGILIQNCIASLPRAAFVFNAKRLVPIVVHYPVGLRYRWCGNVGPPVVTRLRAERRHYLLADVAAPRPNPALIVSGRGWGFEPELGSRRGLGMEVADLPSAETN